jgi:uncharacterized membrane protein
MNWLMGLVGALLGIVVSQSREMLGAAVGFFSLYLLASLFQLRRRFDQQDRELRTVRALLAARDMAAGRPESASSVAKPEFEPLPLDTVVPPPIPAPSEAAPTATFKQAPAAGDDHDMHDAHNTETADAEAARSGWQASLDESEPTPDWATRAAAKVKAWFTEGNVPVKIGVLVLFAGVAAALRYAAAQGYFTFPIELRLTLIAASAVLALALGWRERRRRPAFGMSVQGGALGVLLLTVFAAFRLYGLLPPALAFGVVSVLVAGSALLAVLQKNMALAVLGFLGGYLAPVLISTGSANHVGLFSYYALLNAAVFAISWRQSWRLLNLIGFVFTFTVGTAWGLKFYRPELFASVEPFLVLFFTFYIAIGLLYVIRQTEHRRPWLDGTLVFGTPLAAFPLQAGLLKDDRMALAFSALAVAAIYAGLMYYLRRRRNERLLTEAYGALALGFASLAIPLAFSASTTATLWALEGAGVAWLGIRQGRTFPWIGGLLLQLLAAGSYVIGFPGFDSDVGDDSARQGKLLLLNAPWLGGAMLAFAGYALSLIHDRHRPIKPLAILLFVWATGWWLLAATTQKQEMQLTADQMWRFLIVYSAITAAVAALLRGVLAWSRLNWLIALTAIVGMMLLPSAQTRFGAPLNAPALPVWGLFVSTIVLGLWTGPAVPSRSLAIAHVVGLWWLVSAVVLQLQNFGEIKKLADGWQFLATIAPLAALTLGLWRWPQIFAWPRAEFFGGYRWGWFALAIPLLLFAVVAGLLLEGDAVPLAFLPVLNPLELALIGSMGLLLGWAKDKTDVWSGLPAAVPLFGFVFVTSATLRAVHHWHGEPWSADLFDSGFTQTSLTVVWSLLGVGAWVLGSNRRHRPLWLGGAILMGVVLLKLVLVDRHYMGNMPGIVSFLAVGVLLVGVGYFAPSPPKIENGARS